MLVASDALVAGEVRMVRLESALGPYVQGLHEKREKVPHPGLQHVGTTYLPTYPYMERRYKTTYIYGLNLRYLPT